jgi:hypothetical protein
MVENVAMPQRDFRETGHSSLRTPKAKRRAGDESLSAVTLALWLTGHARRRSCPRLRNSIDLRVSLR